MNMSQIDPKVHTRLVGCHVNGSMSKIGCFSPCVSVDSFRSPLFLFGLPFSFAARVCNNTIEIINFALQFWMAMLQSSGVHSASVPNTTIQSIRSVLLFKIFQGMVPGTILVLRFTRVRASTI